jgi:hypothetical protein
MMPTLSETARYARAELETLASALQAHELARVIELARRILDKQDELRRSEEVAKYEGAGSHTATGPRLY